MWLWVGIAYRTCNRHDNVTSSMLSKNLGFFCGGFTPVQGSSPVDIVIVGVPGTVPDSASKNACTPKSLAAASLSTFTRHGRTTAHVTAQAAANNLRQVEGIVEVAIIQSPPNGSTAEIIKANHQTLRATQMKHMSACIK
eukprot:6465415-Amphidinium_carterae.1